MPASGAAQVALDVDGQRLERADVEHPAAPHRVGRHGLGGQPVEGGQERGERLAGPGRRDDEGVLAAGDRVPRARPAPASARRTRRRARPGWRGRTGARPQSCPRCVRQAQRVSCIRRQKFLAGALARLRPGGPTPRGTPSAGCAARRAAAPGARRGRSARAASSPASAVMSRRASSRSSPAPRRAPGRASRRPRSISSTAARLITSAAGMEASSRTGSVQACRSRGRAAGCRRAGGACDRAARNSGRRGGLLTGARVWGVLSHAVTLSLRPASAHGGGVQAEAPEPPTRAAEPSDEPGPVHDARPRPDVGVVALAGGADRSAVHGPVRTSAAGPLPCRGRAAPRSTEQRP